MKWSFTISALFNSVFVIFDITPGRCTFKIIICNMMQSIVNWLLLLAPGPILNTDNY